MYSKSWKPVKIIPNKIVIISGRIIVLEKIILWWAQVTKIPEANKIEVFNKGTLKGSKGEINKGGHKEPTSCVGTILWWKKAQNQATKNNTSLKIKSLIPHFKPSCTLLVWSPNNLPSRQISRHHKKEKKIKHNKEKSIGKINFNLKNRTKEFIKAPKPLKKGHGLTETIWKEWNKVIINFQNNRDIIIYKKQKVELTPLIILIKLKVIE